MANLDQNKTVLEPIKEEKIDVGQNKTALEPIKEEKIDLSVKPLSSITQENDIALAAVPKEQDVEAKKYGFTDSGKRIKLQENVFEKLKAFFEIVQKQHPESRLELKQVDGNWRVWCGACRKLLRPDKSGKAIHNIQRQHFTSARHKKKLHLMLQAEEEADSRRKNAIEKDSGTHDNEHLRPK